MTEPDAPQVVTAISIALATRLPMRDVDRVHVGGALLEVVRPAPPCRLMDDAIGPGAARAMHDRGGSILRVLESGDIAVGDVWHELRPTRTDPPRRVAAAPPTRGECGSGRQGNHFRTRDRCRRETRSPTAAVAHSVED